MMEVIESTELGAAALQPQRPWVVMSALGMVGGCRRHPSAARDIRRQHTITGVCVAGLSFHLNSMRAPRLPRTHKESG